MAENEELEADVVIAGGGTTACIIAARLAEALPDLKIIVIESGKDTKDDKRVTRPLDGMFSVYEGAEQIRYIRSKPSSELNGRAAVCPVGNILGGSSSINFMMYNNAAASDFDDWKQPGWSFDELKPYIKKTEQFQCSGFDELHGDEGVMGVSRGSLQTPFAEAYFDAWKQVNGLPKVDDIVDYKTGHGCGYLPKLIDSKTGHRSNTAHSYLLTRSHRAITSRIKILCRKTVNKVLFSTPSSTSDTKPRAIGLEIADSPANQLDDASAVTTQIIKARKMVIVCAGAFGSPMILERSGIGGKERLERLGVDCLVDLPGVGEGYQDHELTICSYRATDDTPTLDDYARGDKTVKEAADEEWERTGRGMAGTNGMDFGFKIRPNESEIQQMGPEFAKHWKAVAGDKPDKPCYSGPLVNYFMGPHKRPETGRFFSLGAFSNYPAGRGSVHISSTDPNSPPDFDAGLLSQPADLPVHIWAYKLQREVARRLPMFLGEYPPSHPSFSPNSPAHLISLETPLPKSQSNLIQNLVYSKEDDKAIETWVRQTIGTAYHSMSTCRMKALDQGGVVDPRLRVHGIEGLRVADLSVCTENMGCNTTTVALIIGEKAASLFIEDILSMKE